MALVLVRK